MKKVFLDNAATTPIDPEVFEAMLPYFKEYFGNPSSIHSHGRKVKAGLEAARKTVASLLHATPGEIFFTSGGTEADNMALCQSVHTMDIQHVISSPLEHHAVLHTLKNLEKKGKIKLSLLTPNTKGVFDLNELEKLLKGSSKTMISLMHGNNEIGNLLDLCAVGEIAKEYGVLFHSDTVQTMGHYAFDLKNTPIDYVVGSAHKFHGPKGVGFLYINSENKIHPFIHGGSQERNMRGGTENIYGIIGLAKALELSYANLESHQSHIRNLKCRMINQLKEHIHGVSFNGQSADVDHSLYTVLNVCFPKHPDNEMLLFNLDIEGISVSGGSACSSGTDIGSHVLSAIKVDKERANVRFSFSRLTTSEEVDYTIEILQKLFVEQPA